MTDTRLISLRIPNKILESLDTKDGITNAIISALDDLTLLRRQSDIEIKGVFTPAEWKFLADSLNGALTTDTFRVNKGALIAHCEDSETYDKTASRYDVSIPELSKKIDSLCGAQVDAVYRRVESYWENQPDLEEWTKY